MSIEIGVMKMCLRFNKRYYWVDIVEGDGEVEDKF